MAVDYFGNPVPGAGETIYDYEGRGLPFKKRLFAIGSPFGARKDDPLEPPRRRKSGW